MQRSPLGIIKCSGNLKKVPTYGYGSPHSSRQCEALAQWPLRKKLFMKILLLGTFCSLNLFMLWGSVLFCVSDLRKSVMTLWRCRLVESFDKVNTREMLRVYSCIFSASSYKR